MNLERVKLLVKEGEGLSVEFKEKYTSKIDRDIVAFANTRGGVILLGVRDDGKIVGEALTNKLKSEVNDLARNCEPSISVKKISKLDKVVVVEIDEGDEKPYSCGSGYFRRLDAVTQKMNRKEIELLFKHSFKLSFEEQIHPDVGWDDIDEGKIKAFFKEADIHIGKIEPKKVLSSLNLSEKNGIKNAGMLFFSDDPRKFMLQSEMILVAFKGTERVNIYDRIDVRDDLLTQFNEALIFLRKHLNVRSEIKGINRQDICELPFEALREAVANAIIHRDYSMRGTSLMVEVHEDRVVVKNPGGIPEGLSPSSLINVSVRRNELIADMFARMDKVERMGTGIKRMRDAMKDIGLPYPQIESEVFFTITFERPPYSLQEGKGGQKKVVRKGGQKRWSKLTEKQTKVVQIIEGNPRISRKELALKLGINESAVQKHIENLKKKEAIRRIGPAKGGYWEVIER